MKTKITQCQLTLSVDVQSKIEELKSSLIYAMSKGSHELFHTNIWAWLIERDKRFCNVFFPGMKGVFKCVKREDGNRDLTIWVELNGSRKAYVVENKFKSFPRAEQLENYTKDLGNEFAEGLLVALRIPENIRLVKWNVCTQTELMGRLQEVLQDNTIPISMSDRRVISQYIRMTNCLSEILASGADALSARWPLLVTANLFEDVKLGDIFQKIKASEFVEFIESQPEIGDWRNQIGAFSSKDRSLSLDVESGFSRKQCLLDFRIVMRKPLKDKWSEWAGIGVQIQGGAYNRCVYSYNKAKGADWLDKRFGESWLEDKEFLLPDVSLNSKICSFTTDKYNFRYRGIAIPSDSFKLLFDRLRKEMSQMLDMLRNGFLDELFS